MGSVPRLETTCSAVYGLLTRAKRGDAHQRSTAATCSRKRRCSADMTMQGKRRWRGRWRRREVSGLSITTIYSSLEGHVIRRPRGVLLPLLSQQTVNFRSKNNLRTSKNRFHSLNLSVRRRALNSGDRGIGITIRTAFIPYLTDGQDA